MAKVIKHQFACKVNYYNNMLYPTIKKCKIKFLYSEFRDTNNHDIAGQKSSICLLQHQNTKILCPEI